MASPYTTTLRTIHRDRHHRRRPAPQGRQGAHSGGAGAAFQYHEAGGDEDALPGSLKDADLVFCYAGNLGWDARGALAPLGDKAVVKDDLNELLEAIAAAQNQATMCW